MSDRKERAEHQFVVDAIRDSLAPVTTRLEIPGEPGILSLRNVMHLLTPIRVRLKEPIPPLTLAALLHPTPAVGVTAKREAREVIVDRAECAVNPEDLDWFEREKFEATMEENHRLFRRLEVFRLQAALDSEPVSVKCTPKERSEALRLALALLEGKLPAESAVERFLSE